MLTEKKFFFVAAIICLVLFILSLFIYKTEHFEVPTETCRPSTCTPPDWWENEPPKQIVSLITGVKFPVIAKEPKMGVTSSTQSFQIPFIKTGETSASGCLAYDKEGTYSTEMCDNNKLTQSWSIKPVKNEDDLRTILRPAYASQQYSNIKKFNIDTDPITLPNGVQYGFFIVVSTKNPSIVLASNGGNITVKTMGLHTSELWDITKEKPFVELPVYDTNDYTLLSSSYVNGQQRGQGMPLNSNPGAIYQAPGLAGTGTGTGAGARAAPPNRGGINFNISLGGNSLASLFGGASGTGTSGTDTRTTSTTSTSSPQQSEGFNPNCPSCESPLLDYIQGREIPCLACNPPSILQ
jgi:hypothetical protein